MNFFSGRQVQVQPGVPPPGGGDRGEGRPLQGGRRQRGEGGGRGRSPLGGRQAQAGVLLPQAAAVRRRAGRLGWQNGGGGLFSPKNEK